MKIKLLYIIESMKIGGAEMLVAEICRRIDKDKFDVFVCSLSGGTAITEKLEENDIRYYVFDKNPGVDLSIPFKIKKIIKQEKIQIVHTHCQGPLLYTYLATILGKKYRFIHTEHINMEQELGYSKKHLFYNKLFLNKLDGFISISEHVSKYFHEKYPKISRRMVTIPNGINVDRFSSQNNTNNLRKELRFDNNTKIIGNISALRDQKDHATLLYAMKKIINNIDNVRLVIAGSGYLDVKLKQLADDLNLNEYVRFLGYRSDVENLLSGFDVFVLPSLYEGLPLCLLEASASGTPLVASNIPGNDEIVRNCNNGLLFQTGNSEELANQISKILKDENLSQIFSMNGKTKSAELYNENDMISKYEKYYLNL